MRSSERTFWACTWSIATAGGLVIACGGDDDLPLEEPVYNQYGLRTTEIIGEPGGSFMGANFVGDLDADGYAEFVLLADRGADAPDHRENAAYLFYGRPEYPEHLEAGDADLVLYGALHGGSSNQSVAALGDVDADGYPDFAFMAYCASSACAETNGLHLVYGGKERYEGEFASSEVGLWWTLDSTKAEYHGVSAAGDVDSDGHADLLLVVALDASEDTPPRTGFLLRGREQRDEQLPEGTGFDASFEAGEGETLIMGLESPGDLDADGYSEVVLTTSNQRFPDETPHVLSLFYGSADLAFAVFDPSVAQASFEWSEGSGTAYEEAATGLGDMNDDGYADLAVLAETHLHGSAQTLYLVSSSAERFEGKHDLVDAATWSVETASGYISESGSGDLDADGRLDLVIGDQLDSEIVFNGGALFASMAAGYEPPGSRRLSEEEVLLYGQERAPEVADWLGFSVSTGADADADGFDDILATTPGNRRGDADGGRVVLVFGQALDADDTH